MAWVNDSGTSQDGPPRVPQSPILFFDAHVRHGGMRHVTASRHHLARPRENQPWAAAVTGWGPVGEGGGAAWARPTGLEEPARAREMRGVPRGPLKSVPASPSAHWRGLTILALTRMVPRDP